MNVIEIQMIVISMPVVQMNVDHIHVSVALLSLEMALDAAPCVPVL